MSKARTYATLCIYSDTLTSSMLTSIIKIHPDNIVYKGEKLHLGEFAQNHGWFLSTQDKIESCDLATHIQWLLDQLENKHKIVYDLYENGCKMRLLCFYESVDGNGGPYFQSNLIKSLGKLPIDLFIDIYFLEKGWFRTWTRNHFLI